VAVRVPSRTAALKIKIEKKMEKKFYEAPMMETLELNVKTVILGASDPLEEPSMGGSDAGYTDPGTFKP
jgi:hypothetical protein